MHLRTSSEYSRHHPKPILLLDAADCFLIKVHASSVIDMVEPDLFVGIREFVRGCVVVLAFEACHRLAAGHSNAVEGTAGLHIALNLGALDEK